MYEFEDEKEKIAEPAVTETGNARNWSAIMVQFIGVVLLVVGLWAALHVLLEAMRLYRDPVRIEQLALAIERGSNLDNTLNQNFMDGELRDDNTASTGASRSAPTAGGVRLTYFVAWVVALLILMLIAMIALATIRTGAELLLQKGTGSRKAGMPGKRSG